MKNAIVEKLANHLGDPIDTEPNVVYLLCEIRKLLEADDLEAAPKDLKLFCHWALHVNLDRPGTTKHFLERIDEVLTNYIEGPTTGETIGREDALYRELAYFNTFRSELRETLQKYLLSTDLCDNNEKWANFLLAYTGVIEDGTLAANLRWVESVRFTVQRRSSFKDSRLKLEMVWVVALRQPYLDHSKIEVSVTGTDDRRMVASNLRLRR